MKKLIKILSLVLGALIVYIAISLLIHKEPSKQAYINLPSEKVVNNKDWSEQINKLQTKLNQDASINVLEGTMEIEKTYKNEDAQGTGNRIGFLQRKLAELQSRTLYIQTKYKFGYALDISDMRIEDLGEGNIKINLYKKDLYIKYIEEIGTERQIKDEKGLLAKSFTASEVSALIEVTKVSVKNTLNNNSDIRQKASDYAESTIKGIAEGFGFKNVEVEIIPDGLIDNDEVEIKSIND